jgi:basic amino acid/polyamine antiporter, APA family
MKGQLKKQIGFYGLTMVAVGSCIGSGIFIVPSDIAALLKSPDLIISAWLLGGVVAITGSLTFAELGARFPKVGGVYVYIREAFGHLWAFLYGWSTLTVITSGAIAALSLTFARYLSEYVELDSAGINVLGISVIISVTLINVLGVKWGEVFSNLFTTFKLLGILIIVAAGIALGSAVSDPAENQVTVTPEVSAIGLFALAMIGVLWSIGGWQHASYLSAETKNAERVVPRAMILGALIVTLTYILANIAYMRLLPLEVMAQSNAVAAEALRSVIPVGAHLVTILILISTFGSIGIFTMTAPRIYLAMAQDGKFFDSISKIHPTYGTPVNAILLQSGWAIVILLIWGTFEKVIASVVFMDWIFMIIAAFTVFVYRRRSDEKASFRTPGYPVVPLIFIAISVWFVTYMLFGRPEQALWGLGLLILGLPIYYWGRRRKEM